MSRDPTYDRLCLRAEQVGRLRAAIKIAHDYLAIGANAAAHDVIRRAFAEIEADEKQEAAALAE